MIKSSGKYLFILLLLLGGCQADLQSKKWAKNELKGNPPITLIKGFTELGFVENRGMVFGLFNNNWGDLSKTILTAIRIAILIGVSAFVIMKRQMSIFFLLPFLFVLAGAAGNIIDNILYGHVIDFIHIHAGTLIEWPFYFNLADVYLCIGMGLFLIKSFGNTTYAGIGRRKVIDK